MWRSAALPRPASLSLAETARRKPSGDQRRLYPLQESLSQISSPSWRPRAELGDPELLRTVPRFTDVGELVDFDRRAARIKCETSSSGMSKRR